MHDGFANAVYNIFLCNARKAARRFNGADGVFHLMKPGKRHGILPAVISKHGFAELLALHFGADCIGDHKAVVFFGGGVLNHLQSVRFLPVGGDGDAALFDNSRLFKCDFRNRVAQHFRVVKGNRSNHAHFGTGNNVGRIKTTAEPHFHNGDVTAGVFKIQQRGGGNRLKFRGDNPTPVQTLYRVADDGDGFGECRLGNILVVYLNPLAKRKHIRRREQAGFVTRFHQNAAEHIGGCPLAVRAGDMDEF